MDAVELPDVVSSAEPRQHHRRLAAAQPIDRPQLLCHVELLSQIPAADDDHAEEGLQRRRGVGLSRFVGRPGPRSLERGEEGVFADTVDVLSHRLRVAREDAELGRFAVKARKTENRVATIVLMTVICGVSDFTHR